MIIKIFKSGTSYGHPVRKYLLQDEREPLPRILRGDINLTVDLIDSIPRKWKYTSGVLRFHRDDKPTQSQLEEIMDSFEFYMFAGKSPDSFETVWVEHLDKGSQEIHFVIPRSDLETLQDLNIAPPGYADQHKVWAEKINTTFGFKNPLKATAKSKPKQEANSPKTKRQAVEEQMFALLSNGKLQSRSDLIEALNSIGEVRSDRPNTKFISVKFEGLERRIRFSGGIFAADFDFTQQRPGSKQPSKRSMADYPDEEAKNSRPLHRFELPIADPFGDQDIYKHDIQERYDAAFEYRRKRFEMIRAKSRKLKLAEPQQSTPKQTNDDHVDPEQEREQDNVESLRSARRRTRDRKHRLADLARTERNSARKRRSTFERIGSHLRRALRGCLEVIRSRLKRSADAQAFTIERRRLVDLAVEQTGLEDWISRVNKIGRKFRCAVPAELNAAIELQNERTDLEKKIGSAVASMSEDYQAEVRRELLDIIDAEIAYVTLLSPEFPQRRNDKRSIERETPERPKNKADKPDMRIS